MKKTILLAACGAALAASAAVTADFSQTTAKFRPALHSSGYAPNFERAHQTVWDDKLKEMNFDYVRSHDLGLINCGCRAFDVQYVFPLKHLDPKDPKNYFFDTTDFMLDLQYAIGQKPFYRLGTSIEHTGLVHFAAEIPKDHVDRAHGARPLRRRDPEGLRPHGRGLRGHRAPLREGLGNP